MKNPANKNNSQAKFWSSVSSSEEENLMVVESHPNPPIPVDYNEPTQHQGPRLENNIQPHIGAQVQDNDTLEECVKEEKICDDNNIKMSQGNIITTQKSIAEIPTNAVSRHNGDDINSNTSLIHTSSSTTIQDETVNTGVGYGMYWYADGSSYQGQFVGTIQRQENGVLWLADGSMYEGQFKDDMMNGYGVLKYADGSVYNGEFLANKQHGHGVHLYVSGTSYDGEFKNDMKDGHGIYKYADGTFYDGSFKNDQKNGFGLHKYTSGTEYKGEWSGNKKHGRGFCMYADGDSYDGDFLDNKRHGRGKYFCAADGSVYDGEFRNHMRHGRGVRTTADGREVEMEYKDDKECI